MFAPCVAVGVCNVPCYHPLLAHRLSDGSIAFSGKHSDGQIELPCGRCIGCRLERSRQWAVRCLHEASTHDANCFITLTYRKEVEPFELRYVDFQLFMRRVRRIRKGVRFFMCGEYRDPDIANPESRGFLHGPHFHAILFGLDFPDRIFWGKGESGEKTYRSALLESLWPHGFSLVGDATFESAGYVARYCTKKISGDLAAEHYVRPDQDGVLRSIIPELSHMSLKPGIGSGWFGRFGGDVYPNDHVVVRGVASKPPRYYDKLLEKRDPGLCSELKAERELDGYSRRSDNSFGRLAVKEAVTVAAVSSLSKRSLKGKK